MGKLVDMFIPDSGIPAPEGFVATPAKEGPKGEMESQRDLLKELQRELDAQNGIVHRDNVVTNGVRG